MAAPRATNLGEEKVSGGRRRRGSATGSGAGVGTSGGAEREKTEGGATARGGVLVGGRRRCEKTAEGLCEGWWAERRRLIS